MASVEERAKAKNVNNSTQKASRFRVDQSEEGKTAAAAFREPAAPTGKKSGGGGGLFGLFGGGGSKSPVEKAASAVNGAVNGATQKVLHVGFCAFEAFV
jgi:predicted lipid-binding transport protein (Tim44 family)